MSKSKLHLSLISNGFGNGYDLYSLHNSKNTTVEITNYGATITSIQTVDKQGQKGCITLGFDDWDQHVKHSRYFGCIVGRYANRIALGKFPLVVKSTRDDEEEEKTVVCELLAKNNGENHLHGGAEGFDKKKWELIEDIKDHDNHSIIGVKLQYVSADGEEGYPGELTTQVTYTLNDDNELRIEYDAWVNGNQQTILNLTNHSYFNLTGDAVKENVLDHQVTICADKITGVNQSLIPTGELISVQGTPLDFRQSHSIGERLHQIEPGYDHNFVLNKKQQSGDLELAATVCEPKSGRTMECYTTQPGVQFYTGNFLSQDVHTFDKYHGFCLETQHYPDSPNHPEFPTTVLKPNEHFKEVTVYKFGVQNE